MVVEIYKQIIEGNVSVATGFSVFDAFVEGSTEGAIASLLILGILFVLLAFTALYIYHAIAWSTIAKKLKHKYPWLAWIPFAGSAMRLQIGGFHWAWIFLVLLPVFGWIALSVLLVISHWRIFEKRKYPGWFSLSWIVPKLGGIIYLIIIGYVAWKDRRKMLFK